MNENNSKKKCYIATFKYNNYGTKLQNFALINTIENMGIETISIVIKENENLLKVLIKRVLEIIPAMTKRQKLWKNERIKKCAFYEFNKLLNYKSYSINELAQIDFSNAFAIAGSDQIWSPQHFESVPNDKYLFFLKFVPCEKRFSYAPSFGVSQIPKLCEDEYRNSLKTFAKLSVREDDGKRIIEDLLNVETKVVPDPVFMLTADMWRNEIKGFVKEDKKYILTYFLGTPCRDLLLDIQKLSSRKGLMVKNIAGNVFHIGDVVPSPMEFVSLIDNASLVITDSFHACAFSIIMKTKFYVIERSDVKQFSRIETLLKKYDLTNCKLDVPNYIDIDLNTNQNEKIIDKKLIKERELALIYLNEIIKEV